MYQPIDNCVRNMRSDKNVVSAEKPEKTRHSSRIWWSVAGQYRWAASILTFQQRLSFSLTCWASMRGPYRSRVKVEARRLTITEIIRKSG